MNSILQFLIRFLFMVISFIETTTCSLPTVQAEMEKIDDFAYINFISNLFTILLNSNNQILFSSPAEYLNSLKGVAFKFEEYCIHRKNFEIDPHPNGNCIHTIFIFTFNEEDFNFNLTENMLYTFLNEDVFSVSIQNNNGVSVYLRPPILNEQQQRLYSDALVKNIRHILRYLRNHSKALVMSVLERNNMAQAGNIIISELMPQNIPNSGEQHINSALTNRVENYSDQNCLSGQSSSHHDSQIHFGVTNSEDCKSYATIDSDIKKIIIPTGTIERDTVSQYHLFKNANGNPIYFLNETCPQEFSLFNLQIPPCTSSLNFTNNKNASYSSNCLLSQPVLEIAGNDKGEQNLQTGTFAYKKENYNQEFFSQDGSDDKKFKVAHESFNARIIKKNPGKSSGSIEIILDEESNIGDGSRLNIEGNSNFVDILTIGDEPITSDNSIIDGSKIPMDTITHEDTKIQEFRRILKNSSIPIITCQDDSMPSTVIYEEKGVVLAENTQKIKYNTLKSSLNMEHSKSGQQLLNEISGNLPINKLHIERTSEQDNTIQLPIHETTYPSISIPSTHSSKFERKIHCGPASGSKVTRTHPYIHHVSQTKSRDCFSNSSVSTNNKLNLAIQNPHVKIINPKFRKLQNIKIKNTRQEIIFFKKKLHDIQITLIYCRRSIKRFKKCLFKNQNISSKQIYRNIENNNKIANEILLKLNELSDLQDWLENKYLDIHKNKRFPEFNISEYKEKIASMWSVNEKLLSHLREENSSCLPIMNDLDDLVIVLKYFTR